MIFDYIINNILQRLDIIRNDQDGILRRDRNNESTNCEDLLALGWLPWTDSEISLITIGERRYRATHCLNETMQNKTLQAGMIF